LWISSLSNLGVGYRSLGRYEEAQLRIEEALRWGREVYGASHPRVLEMLNNLAAVMVNAGDYMKARELALSALDLDQLNQKEPSAIQVAALANLGIALGAVGSFGEARSALLSALLSAYQLSDVASGPLRADVQVALGEVYTAMGDTDRARAAFEVAVAESERMGIEPSVVAASALGDEPGGTSLASASQSSMAKVVSSSRVPS
jgi:tetratricopeptide (TPR) repeat protein